MIIRSHECVLEGYDRSSGGELITLFSAADYCGKYKNPAAIISIQRNNEIAPKLIYPLSNSTGNWIDTEETLKRRPATPPRAKQRG